MTPEAVSPARSAQPALLPTGLSFVGGELYGVACQNAEQSQQIANAAWMTFRSSQIHLERDVPTKLVTADGSGDFFIPALRIKGAPIGVAAIVEVLCTSDYKPAAIVFKWNDPLDRSRVGGCFIYNMIGEKIIEQDLDYMWRAKITDGGSTPR